MAEITEDQIRDGTPIDESEMRTDMGPGARRASAALPPPRPETSVEPGPLQVDESTTPYGPASRLRPMGSERPVDPTAQGETADPMARDIISWTALGPLFSRAVAASRFGQAAETLATSESPQALRATAGAWKNISGPNAARIAAEAEAEAAAAEAAAQTMQFRSPLSFRGAMHNMGVAAAKAAPMAPTSPLSTSAASAMFAGIPRRPLVGQ